MTTIPVHTISVEGWPMLQRLVGPFGHPWQGARQLATALRKHMAFGARMGSDYEIDALLASREDLGCTPRYVPHAAAIRALPPRSTVCQNCGGHLVCNEHGVARAPSRHARRRGPRHNHSQTSHLRADGAAASCEFAIMPLQHSSSLVHLPEGVRQFIVAIPAPDYSKT